MQDNVLLEVDDLEVSYWTPTGYVAAVKKVSFGLASRERLAVVGESGSGKSTVFNSLLGLLPDSSRVLGKARLLERSILGLSETGYKALRGRHIGMIVQDPLQGLDPMKTVGFQIGEMLRLHRICRRRQVRTRVLELLDDVGIKEPVRVAASYPHQLSGGMGQRVMITMILAAEPEVLVADEATSALDSRLRDSILELINLEIQKRNMGLILISHDLELVARHADRVLVMYAGRIVEEVKGSDVESACHPYTRGLLNCRPRLSRAGLPLATLVRDPAWLN